MADVEERAEERGSDAPGGGRLVFFSAAAMASAIRVTALAGGNR